MKRFLIITLSWITLAISPSASAFDCNKAKLSVEKIICKDAELSAFDDTLNVSYQYALKQNNEKLQILNTQRQWLHIVRNRCRTATCLKHVYVTRINEITLVSSFGDATQHPSPDSKTSSAPTNPNQSTVPQCENQTYSHGEYTGKYLGAVIERSIYPHWAKFIQETKGEALGSNQVALIRRFPLFVHFAKLCNGNIVAVGQFDNSSSSNPHLMASFFDDNFHPLLEWFRIAHPDEQQWEHSVAALGNGGFVTTWKSSKNLTKGAYHVNFRSRIFNSIGKPMTDSFFVTEPSEAYKDTNATNATVYGLPNGGFVLIFLRDSAGNFLRIVNSKGLPVTPEIQFAKYNDFAVHPIVFITPEGIINIFLPNEKFPRINQPIKSAYSFNAEGAQLKETKDINEMKRISGYQEAIENLGSYL